MQKNTKKKIAPIVVAVLVILYAGPLIDGGEEDEAQKY